MRKTRLSMKQAFCRSLRFLCLSLVLLVAACTNVPASSAFLTHNNRGSSAFADHRLSWAHQYGLRGGVVARWHAHRFGGNDGTV